MKIEFTEFKQLYKQDNEIIKPAPEFVEDLTAKLQKASPTPRRRSALRTMPVFAAVCVAVIGAAVYFNTDNSTRNMLNSENSENELAFVADSTNAEKNAEDSNAVHEQDNDDGERGLQDFHNDPREDVAVDNSVVITTDSKSVRAPSANHVGEENGVGNSDFALSSSTESSADENDEAETDGNDEAANFFSRQREEITRAFALREERETIWDKIIEFFERLFDVEND
jgi:hypothetical protein